MIHRCRDGWEYRNGLNWEYRTIGRRWWITLVLRVGRLKLGFRYRSRLWPHLINYSEILPK